MNTLRLFHLTVLMAIASGCASPPPAWAGISVEQTEKGYLIRDVVRGKSAHSVGLMAGDVIFEINDQGVAGLSRRAFFKALEPELDWVQLGYIREGVGGGQWKRFRKQEQITPKPFSFPEVDGLDPQLYEEMQKACRRYWNLGAMLRHTFVVSPVESGQYIIHADGYEGGKLRHFHLGYTESRGVGSASAMDAPMPDCPPEVWAGWPEPEPTVKLSIFRVNAYIVRPEGVNRTKLEVYIKNTGDVPVNVATRTFTSIVINKGIKPQEIAIGSFNDFQGVVPSEVLFAIVRIEPGEIAKVEHVLREDYTGQEIKVNYSPGKRWAERYGFWTGSLKGKPVGVYPYDETR